MYYLKKLFNFIKTIRKQLFRIEYIMSITIELWVIYNRIKTAWEKGHEYLILETNSVLKVNF